MEGFQKMDTSAQKSQFEKTAATIDQALEILEKYAPEKKVCWHHWQAGNLSVPRRFTRRCRTRICICRLRMRLSSWRKAWQENHANILKMSTKIDNIMPWVSMDIPMNTTGTKNTDVLIGTIEREVTQEQI